jgi:short-subunit dehydrogenase
VGSSRTVLITGASSGIGAALALELASRGDTVGLVARREDRLGEVLDACRATAPESRCWVADLAEPGAPEAVAARALEAFGHVDVLVNNAATPARRPVTSLTAEDVARVMHVNLQSPVALTLALLPSMLERGRGTIVNVSSLGGRLGIQGEAAYCASKFALCGWSEALALDLWKTPIEVRLIVPGPVDTEIWDQPGNDPAHYDGELVAPEEVARGIAEAIDGNTFEHYLPDLKSVALYKAEHIDDYLRLSVEALDA